MPENIKKYRLLISSPSDLKDERQAIDEVIKELNISFGQSKSLILEAIKWETHSAPGINSISVQSIINEDIGSNYDLYIGLLWTRFGTPTNIAESGTEEEFQIAYQHYKNNPKSIQILFYFKTAPPDSLDKIDPTQFAKVVEFKTSLGDKNIFHWEFRELSELQQYLRIHIVKRIEELEKSVNNKISDENTSESLVNFEEIEELGIIDHEDNLVEYFHESSQALSRITEAMTWVTGKINQKTGELNKLKKSKNEISNKILRSHFQRTAEVMNDFAHRMEPHIPIFARNFERGLNTISQIINLTDDVDENILSAYNSSITLNQQILETSESMDEFLNSVIKLPRIEKELNRSRRNVEEKLSRLIEELKISYSISNEVILQFRNKYNFE